MKLSLLRKLLWGARSQPERQQEPAASLQPSLALVAIIEDEQDRSTLREAAEQEHWQLYFAKSCEEAWHLAERLQAQVILCDRDLPEMEWRQAVGVLASLAHRPVVVLISPVADEYLWNELFRIGGFDLLRKPLRTGEVARVLKLALSYRHSESLRDESPAVNG